MEANNILIKPKGISNEWRTPAFALRSLIYTAVLLMGAVHALIAAPAPIFELAEPGESPGIENPFLIEKVGDITNLAKMVNTRQDYTVGDVTAYYAFSHYRMTKDIRFSKSRKAVASDTSNFTPIGIEGDPFGGTFDGNGHTITGLRLHSSEHRSVGLFSVVTKARLTNITLSNTSLTNSFNSTKKSYGGSLVGAISGSEIISCRLIAGVVQGGDDATLGGLVGYAEETMIENSEAMGSVSGGDGANVGGLVGHSSGSKSVIKESMAGGDISGGGVTSAEAQASIGGLVGEANEITILNATATGTVSGGDGAKVGGLVGDSKSNTTITASTASGVTRGGNAVSRYSARVGGLVGISQGTIIGDSTATGAVSAGDGSIVGGLVGLAFDETTIISSAASGETQVGKSASGYFSRVGGLVGVSSESVIENATAGGAVLGGDGALVGGLAGVIVGGRLDSVKALGDVRGGSSTSEYITRIGGLVGVTSETSIAVAEATGSTSGGDGASIGRLIGLADEGTILDSLNVSGTAQ